MGKIIASYNLLEISAIAAKLKIYKSNLKITIEKKTNTNVLETKWHTFK